MAVTLRDVTQSNFEECIRLKLGKSQNFVASNVYSIAESKVCTDWIAKAIYAGTIMAGFIMFKYDYVNKELYISRLMIALEHQKKGYAKSALDIIKKIAIKNKRIKTIKLSTQKENLRAIRFYQKFGFKDTGKMDGREEIFVLDVYNRGLK